MILFECPFLQQPVRMSGEREAHILFDHDELGPGWPSHVAEVMVQPDEIRWST